MIIYKKVRLVIMYVLSMKKMGFRKFITLLFLPIVLLVTSLACSATPATIPADVTKASTRDRIAEPESISVTSVEVKAWAVNIRDLSGKPTGEFAEQGQALHGYVSGEWFILVDVIGQEYGKVWLGCLNVDSSYGCMAQ